MSTPGAPGWYDDPSAQTRFRYWDGEHWTARTSNARSVSRAGEHPTGLGDGFARLGDWLGRLLAACSLVSLAYLVVVIWGYTVLSPFGDAIGSLLTPGSPTLTSQVQDDLTRVGLALFAVYLLDAVLRLVTGVVWLVWQYRLADSAPVELKRSPGLQLVAWIIPFVNWWWPYQDIGHLWRAYGRNQDEATSATPGSVVAWWSSYIGCAFIVGILLSWALTGGSGALVERATLAFGLFALSQAVAAYFARDVVRQLSWRALVYAAAAHRA